MFSTSVSGLDFDFPMIMLLPDCEGLLCKLDVLDDQPAAAAPPLSTVTLVSKGGRPLATIPEYPVLPDLSDDQTDPFLCLSRRTRPHKLLCQHQIVQYLVSALFARMTFLLG